MKLLLLTMQVLSHIRECPKLGHLLYTMLFSSEVRGQGTRLYLFYDDRHCSFTDQRTSKPSKITPFTPLCKSDIFNNKEQCRVVAMLGCLLANGSC